MSILVVQRFGVYYCESFQFEDGTSKNKYFIALNCSLNDTSINLVLPTSQYEKYYKNSNYYLIDTVVIKNGESIFFDKKTVIDLKNIQVVNSNILSINNVIYKGILEKDICDVLEKVIKDSRLLTSKLIKELLCIK